MTLEVSKVGANQQQQVKVNNPATSAPTTVGVGQGGVDSALQARLDELGIDYETYMFYCEKNKDFAVMSVKEQLAYIKSLDANANNPDPVAVVEMTESEMAARSARLGITLEEYQHLAKYHPTFASDSFDVQKEHDEYARSHGLNILELRPKTEAEKAEAARVQAEKAEAARKEVEEYNNKLFESIFNEEIQGEEVPETPFEEREIEIVSVEEETESVFDFVNDETFESVRNEYGFNFNKFNIIHTYKL